MATLTGVEIAPLGHRAVGDAGLVSGRGRLSRATGRRKLAPGWPLTAMLVGFPIWWVLGLSSFSFIILAVPMALELSRRRPVRLPRGFAIWALYLFWTLLSVVAIGWQAPGTLPSSGSKFLGYGLRLANYLAQTVVLLYVGNLSESECSRRRIVRMLSVLFIWTVAGGWLGMIAPNFNFNSPVELLLPHSIRQNQYVASLVHPAAAQVQAILGYASGRPKAPFSYTNVWGANLAVLACFFLLHFWGWGNQRQRIIAVLGCLLALAPAVYSLNRGLWVAAGFAICYLAVRLALRGRFGALMGIGAVAIVSVFVFVVSPLNSVINQRLAHPQSNSIRSTLSAAALKGALASPIIGYGTDREMLGSANSIAVGKTAKCQTCGNAAIGSNGQFWLTLFSQGFPGAIMYTLFFLVVFWRSWKDRSPLGTAGTLVVLMSLLFNFVYPGAGSSLELYMIAVGLLWRNEIAARTVRPGLPVLPAESPA
ncbi:MAG: O-antigen ligase family protein [Acidimicrobiales bacterium]